MGGFARCPGLDHACAHSKVVKRDLYKFHTTCWPAKSAARVLHSSILVTACCRQLSATVVVAAPAFSMHTTHMFNMEQCTAGWTANAGEAAYSKVGDIPSAAAAAERAAVPRSKPVIDAYCARPVRKQ